MPQSKSALLSPDALDAGKFEDEAKRIAELLAEPALDPAERRAAAAAARDIVLKARAETRRSGVMESFLEEFGLSNPEGLALMCLAEALLRVPDVETADALIAEKISSGEWSDHRGKSDSLLVNASTWGLMLTGRIVHPPEDAEQNPGNFMQRMVRQAGEPVIRAAMMQAMRIMGGQFVMGRTIGEALKRGQRTVKKGEAASHSFDMLGEGARTTADARRYFDSYANAIGEVGKAKTGDRPETADGISVKLSALHPAYRAVQGERVHRELYPMVLELAKLAAKQNINFTLDAEEADRLALSLSLLEKLAREPGLAPKWTGLGLAVQAYQKRGEAVVGWLGQLAADTNRRMMVRLVKGAYWDSEIKRAQVEGQPDYPVFTTKQATDVSYLTCANALLEDRAVDLSAVRHAQRQLAGWDRADGEARGQFRLRVPAPARHGRAALQGGGSRAFGADLCAGRRAPGLCCRISCGACWRMAPTHPSCIPSSTRTCRPSASRPILTRCCPQRPRAIRAFRHRPGFMALRGRIRVVSISASLKCASVCMRRSRSWMPKDRWQSAPSWRANLPRRLAMQCRRRRMPSAP